MHWDELKTRFPDLQPMNGVPWLFNLFGCGLMIYGGRDRDPEFGSVVRTRYLCVLGIPTLALGSYRMVPNEHGWFILGREPISRLAAWMNVILLLLGLGGGALAGVRSVVLSEGYQARRKLDRADGMAASGRVDEAAALYEEVACGSTDASVEAAGRLASLAGRAEPVPAGQLAALFRSSSRVAKAGRWPGGGEKLYEVGMARVNRLAADDPGAAALTLEEIAALAPRGDDVSALVRELLERAVAARPEDVTLATRLAAAYEAENLSDRAAEVLEPLRGRLGESDGARILGLIDARAGRVEPALMLLRAYTRPRLQGLARAEAQLKSGVRSAEGRIVRAIKDRDAPGFDYAAATRAKGDEQQQMVAAYIDRRLKDDPEVARLLDAIRAEAVVTPAALELGMLLLQQAQLRADPEARARLLVEAESTFLAIHQVAGDEPNYGISLGQVYYWEGKPAEGRAEFDRVLQARGREPALILLVASTLRELGSESEARTLAEEAFRVTNDLRLRSSAATLRGLLEDDLDARLDWLRKGDSDEPFARATLRHDEALKALRDGDEEAAIHLLRESAGLYEGMKEGPEMLNNLSIVLSQLAALTGEEDAAERAASLIERAAQLDSRNSLTVGNAARARLRVAAADLIGAAIDLKRLKMSADLALLHFLYDDRVGEEAMALRAAKHPGIARYLALQRTLLILAPRNGGTYECILAISDVTGDLETLRDLARRVAAADIEPTGRRVEPADAGALAAALGQAEEAVTAARSAGHGATLAVALARLVGARLALARSARADRDDIGPAVATAEEAFAASPSVGMRSLLIAALLARAEARLARDDPDYAGILAETRDDLDARDRVCAALAADGPYVASLSADPDVARAVGLVREDFERRPKSCGTRSWALLRTSHPDVAARVAEAFLGSEAERLAFAIGERLEPNRAYSALSGVLVRLMEGRPQEAAEAWSAYRARGLRLPPIGAR